MPPALNLYRSGWNPRGVRKDWERCPMDHSSTTKMLGHWHALCGGEMLEAVGWLDDDGGLRVLVADYASGRRIIIRNLVRGTKITFERVSQVANDSDKEAVPGPGAA